MVSSGSGSGGIKGRIRLGGRISPPRPPAGAGPVANPAPTANPRPVRKRVLFVCIGNSVRSQMAESFARAYGADVMDVSSAGLSPATLIAPLTRQVLSEKNVRFDEQFPKGLEAVSHLNFDVVVNISGAKLAVPAPRQIDWPVPDPIGQKEEVYRSAAATIEGLVMRLILELRTEKTG
jgi:arsenate reductase